MIAIILLKLFLFSGILFVFGWQLARFILNEKRIEALIPLAAILGPGVYLFLLNLSSYLIPIRINFYNKYWSEGLEEKCLDQTGLDLRLEFSETGSNEVARIYLIK